MKQDQEKLLPLPVEVGQTDHMSDLKRTYSVIASVSAKLKCVLRVSHIGKITTISAELVAFIQPVNYERSLKREHCKHGN